MTKKNLVYVWSLRNAAADKAGQPVAYKDHERYMKSVLEFLVGSLNDTPLGEAYNLVGVVYDDDEQNPRDQQLVADYGFAYQPGRQWLYPADLRVQGTLVNDLLLSVPSTYRRLPRGSAEHVAGKQDFERRLHDTLVELKADIVVLDGLLVILDELVRPGAPFARRIMNIHPGITRLESPYERRGRTPPGMRCTAHVGRRSPTGRAKRRRRANRCIGRVRHSTTWIMASIRERCSTTCSRPRFRPRTPSLSCAGTTSTTACSRHCMKAWSCWPSKAEPCRSELAREKRQRLLAFPE